MGAGLILVDVICGCGLLQVWCLCALLVGLPLWFDFGGFG